MSNHWKWRPGDKGRAGREEDVEPARLRQNGGVHSFNKSAGLMREEIAVRVQKGIHIGIQPPARGEAQSQLSRGEHAQESDHQNDQDNDPVIPPALNYFHGQVP